MAGLLSWLIVGTATGALVALPGRRGARSAAVDLALGAGGGLGGGLLATVLGFGGYAVVDWRAVATALLAALLSLLLRRATGTAQGR